MKLNCACGNRPLKGYVNIDIDSPHADLIADVTKLPFKECVFEEVYSRAVLEHISWRKTFDVLYEWRRVLKFGGKLIVIVPDWDWLKKQNKTAYEIAPWLLGAQRNEYDYHKAIFDKKTIIMFFKQIGMNKIKVIRQGYYLKAEGIK